jgi:hypothetical protein
VIQSTLPRFGLLEGSLAAFRSAVVRRFDHYQ